MASKRSITVGGVADRRRRSRRRPVHDADEDARRRGDHGPDRRARVGGLRDRAGGRAEVRGRRRAAAARSAVADSRHRRHPLQRLAGPARDRRGRRGRPDQPGEHRRPGQGRDGRQGRKEEGHADAHRRQLRLAAQASRGRCPEGPGRGARRRRDGGGRAAREARLPRLQDLGQVEPRADDDPGLPHALGQGALPAAPGRDRGGHAVLRLDQERGRHGRAARRRHRRHHARSRSPPTRSRRSRPPGRSSRRSACASGARS